MTEEQCIKWVQKHLPFAMKSKKGKLMYPFKSVYFAREIEKNLGKDLFKLLNNDKATDHITLTEEGAEIFNNKA